MNVILCTVSDTHYNDSVVPGFVHFSVKAILKKKKYRIARFMQEQNYIELLDEKGDHEKDIISEPDSSFSPRYLCVKQLGSLLKAGDLLMADKLSDLGNTAEEVENQYMNFVGNGIELMFYDNTYVNTSILGLSFELSSYQKMIIHNMVENYFSQRNNDNTPPLTGEELMDLSEMKEAKKK